MASYLTLSLSMLLYIIAAEVLTNFIIADANVKGVQIGAHEIKVINFADDTTIFLRDIDCLPRIQAILNLYEKASSSKINLSKSQALWVGAYKNRFDKPGKMVWSNFSIKILGITFENYTPDNSIWEKITKNITKRILIWNRVRLSLKDRRIIINQVLLSKLWYIGQIYTIPKNVKKQIEKRIYDFLREEKKIRPPRHLIQLPIWKGGLGILEIDTQLNSLKIKWIQRLLHPATALWKDLILYRLNLILNSNQGLASFRQNQILRSIRHKNLQNYNNEDFFLQLLKASLIFTKNNFPSPRSIEEILDQPLFLNPHTKINHSSDNPYFFSAPPKYIEDKFIIIRDICRFLQPGFMSSNSFKEKLNRPKKDSNKIYRSIIELIPNNWIQILKNKTSQESLLKVFHFNDRGIRKIKNFQKVSNKDIYYTLQNNNDDYNRPFKFIPWQNHFQENPVLSPEIWGKTFNDWFKECSNGYIFSLWYKLTHFSLPLNPAIHRMGNSSTPICPRCKEYDETHPHFLFRCKLSQTTLNFINKLINLNYTLQSPFRISIKDIIMGNSTYSHDGVKLEILPTLIEVFLRHLYFCRRKAFYEDDYSKINELTNYKGNLV